MPPPNSFAKLKNPIRMLEFSAENNIGQICDLAFLHKSARAKDIHRQIATPISQAFRADYLIRRTIKKVLRYVKLASVFFE